jgi:hypothetical protein
MELEDIEIERKDTGIRVVLSLLYWVIMEVVKMVLVVIVIYELIYTLITKKPPSEGVRNFANRALSYQYRMLRYLTYNEPYRPFPLAEFPPEVEPSGPITG